MTAVIGIREARARFSELVERVAQGESFSITRRGREVARLDPPRPTIDRRPGTLKGRIVMAPDFDETPEEVLQSLSAPPAPS